MRNRRRNSTQETGSYRYSEPPTNGSVSNINQDDLQELDFSEIPRVADESRGSAFYTSNIYRKSTLFDPASSEIQYQDMYSPIEPPVNVPRRQPTAEELNVWNFFTDEYNDLNLYIEGDSAVYVDKTSKKESSIINSKLSKETQHDATNEIEQVVPEKTPNKQSSQVTVTHQQLRRQPKEEQLTILKQKLSLEISQHVYNYVVRPSGITGPKIPRVNNKRKNTFRKLLKRQQESLEQIQGALKLGFVELDEQEQDERSYPLRKTRMAPLKYWCGERISYKEHVANGYFAAEKK